jgi:hypothetical protein
VSENWRVRISGAGADEAKMDEVRQQCARSLPDLDVNRTDDGVVIYAGDEDVAQQAAELAEDFLSSLSLSALHGDGGQ